MRAGRAWFLLLIAAPAWAQWTNLGGGDHGGTDWIPANGTAIAGVHTNIGTFTVTAGFTITVQPYNGTQYGTVDINANTAININGTLSADQAGYLGGGAGLGGADGSCACGVGGVGAGGGLGDGPTGSGGSNGTSGTATCPVASAGGGGGGSYGAAGGAGGLGRGGIVTDD